jgi:hypothetical protein
MKRALVFWSRRPHFFPSRNPPPNRPSRCDVSQAAPWADSKKTRVHPGAFLSFRRHFFCIAPDLPPDGFALALGVGHCRDVICFSSLPIAAANPRKQEPPIGMSLGRWKHRSPLRRLCEKSSTSTSPTRMSTRREPIKLERSRGVQPSRRCSGRSPLR